MSHECKTSSEAFVNDIYIFSAFKAITSTLLRISRLTIPFPVSGSILNAVQNKELKSNKKCSWVLTQGRSLLQVDFSREL